VSETDELSAIASEAYIFLYPLVTMELTRLQATNIEAEKMPGRGPMNSLNHIREFPAADFKLVVRPNFDTLYSSAFIDVSNEPVLLSAPDTEGRYYMLPMLDMWTDVFAVPGKRTSGTAAANWAIVPRGWDSQLPDGVGRIEAPTPYVWLIGRTQTNGPSDYPAVHAVQDGYRLVRLSQWWAEGTPDEVVVDPSVDMSTPPLDMVGAMSGAEFFSMAAELMKLHPPHVTDWSQIERMGRIGIRVGESFDASALSDGQVQAVESAPLTAQASMAALLPVLAVVSNGWQMNTNSIGVYGDFYAKRAVVAMLGLGANPPEDAIYPLLIHDADGDAVEGSTDYILHFEASELPPVEAFWSVTMYDDHGFQVANELSRFAIADRDPLVYGADGSLDLYIQNTNPGPEREANWLPSPLGPLGITMRLYVPEQSVLMGAWVPPSLRKAK
jgi:hypothetical protein